VWQLCTKSTRGLEFKQCGSIQSAMAAKKASLRSLRSRDFHSGSTGSIQGGGGSTRSLLEWPPSPQGRQPSIEEIIDQEKLWVSLVHYVTLNHTTVYNTSRSISLYNNM
jgi:hypothetical protein